MNARTSKISRMMRIGLTGGIAAGKSTVSKYWQELGGAEVAVIESDELAHRTLEPGTATWEAVVKEFGREILMSDNKVDRKKLGKIVFEDEQRRQALNDIVHPVVREMWRERLSELAATGVAREAVVVVPLLYEVGAEDEFDHVVVVACSEVTQMSRLMSRGIGEQQARARVMSQWPMPQKMERGDFVIWNDGTLPVLQRQAELVLKTIQETNHAASEIKQEG